MSRCYPPFEALVQAASTPRSTSRHSAKASKACDARELIAKASHHRRVFCPRQAKVPVLTADRNEQLDQLLGTSIADFDIGDEVNHRAAGRYYSANRRPVSLPARKVPQDGVIRAPLSLPRGDLRSVKDWVPDARRGALPLSAPILEQ